MPLLWRPWYLDQLESPDGAIWVWSLVQNACALPDPAAFPRFAVRWSPETSAMTSRYLAIVERLLATNVMNAGASIKVDLLTGGVTKSVPADDATLGFAALLRQLFNDREEASSIVFARPRGAQHTKPTHRTPGRSSRHGSARTRRCSVGTSTGSSISLRTMRGCFMMTTTRSRGVGDTPKR